MLEKFILNSHRKILFDAFKDTVYIDKKLFNICKERQTYYLYEGEDEPHQGILHRSHITKIMFLVSVARPRRDISRNVFLAR